MDRRRFLKTAGAGTVALLAGCNAQKVDTTTKTTESGGGGGTTTGTTVGTTEGTPTLRVTTYPSFVDAPSTSPGAWVKETFESEYDAELKWFVPNNQLNYFIQRKNQGVTIDTDLYLGLTPENLVHADEGVSDGSLFDSVDTGGFENIGHVEDTYRFDPQDRVLPFGASYISLVYNQNMLDEQGVSAPETFEDLTKPEYEGAVICPNPQNSETGLEFLFWTIIQYGEDGYLDYWKRLADNDIRILKSWDAAYAAYSNGDVPIVVSYSTDQVFADQYDEPMAEHQIGFLNNQGYAYIEGMARFAGTENPGLAADFMDFMLRADVQSEIAVRNVADPVVDNADLPSDFDELTKEPEEPVGFGYDDLSGNVSGWLDEWSKQIATQ